MSNIPIHAPDGGMFGHALCEEPTGDTTTWERDVTCSECLDLLEASTVPWERLIAKLAELRQTPRVEGTL